MADCHSRDDSWAIAWLGDLVNREILYYNQHPEFQGNFGFSLNAGPVIMEAPEVVQKRKSAENRLSCSLGITSYSGPVPHAHARCGGGGPQFVHGNCHLYMRFVHLR